MRTKTMKSKTTKVAKPATVTNFKSVTVALNNFNLTATQESKVTGSGKNKTVVPGPFRFALTDAKGNLVATTGNKKLPNLTTFNKKAVKAVAPTVLPVVKKMMKTGELSL